MVTFSEKKILIDGKPIFLLSGETHYFRQPVSEWQHLLDEAKALGLNCISSYVPWLLHEEVEGQYCFEGQLDLGAFIDLCRDNGLYFFVRPGPFIMAEMKKEGIPYWVAKKHSDAVPVGFDGAVSQGNNLDYLNPGYLEECRKWYQKIMSIIAPRLHCNGGNVIGVQLDNEIGMLNWVTNSPMLNENTLSRFTCWLQQEYPAESLKQRYPFSLTDPAVYIPAFRSPAEDWAVPFHLDFGKFLRAYYAEYVHILKGYAEEAGIHDTPFFINIHGTGESRIFDFPLGVSQLWQSYNQDGGLISGTDVYLGEPTEGTYQDLYVANTVTDAMNKVGNPLTSIEFECSDGPYCSLSGLRYHPSATAHKMLMCLSQNARMLSFYVFSGGENYPLHHPEPDGNGRMAFTHQLHGLNAPVQPDGSHNFSFDSISATAQAIHTLNELVASSRQETDGVSLGYIPDYFLTEMAYPSSQNVKNIQQNLKKWRCAGAIDSAARGMLSNGIAFDGLDIQGEDIPKGRALAVLSARYMPADVQKKLVSFLKEGGRLFLYGELPSFDLEGNACTILLKALSLSQPSYIQGRNPGCFPTLHCTGSFEGTAPDYVVDTIQCFQPDGSEILTTLDKQMAGFIKHCGQGLICAVTADYPADMNFYRQVWQTLGVTPAWSAPYYRQGIYISSTLSSDGQRLLYILNLDTFEKRVDINWKGKTLFKDFLLTEKAALILPLGVHAGEAEILCSTAQLVGIDDESLRFRLSQRSQDKILLKSVKKPCAAECSIEKTAEGWLLCPHGNDDLLVTFEA